MARYHLALYLWCSLASANKIGVCCIKAVSSYNRTICFSQLIPTLQVAIGPVVLISGIGLLILSMTNRFGRVIDRGRILARELVNVPAQDQIHIEAQLQILTRRAEYLRRAITAASISVLLAAVLIITLFITAVLKVEDAWLIGLLFTGSMGALIFSLIYFLQDLNESLLAFKLDIVRD